MDRLWARLERMKHQSPNTKLQRNPKLQIPKPVAGSLPWSLGLGASLGFGVWCLEFGVWSFNRRPLLRRREREKALRRNRSLRFVVYPADGSLFVIRASFVIRISSFVIGFVICEQSESFTLPSISPKLPHHFMAKQI